MVFFNLHKSSHGDLNQSNVKAKIIIYNFFANIKKKSIFFSTGSKAENGR